MTVCNRWSSLACDHVLLVRTRRRLLWGVRKLAEVGEKGCMYVEKELDSIGWRIGRINGLFRQQV